MFKKSLFAIAVAAALGLSMTAAEARDFDHRDNGVRHTEYRHGHHVRHHHGNHHHFARHDGRR